MKIPTPIAASLDVFNRYKASYSGLQKYKALEATYQSLIKHLAITFLMIAKDRNEEVYALATSKIVNSSSLGGWVKAMETIHKRISELEFNGKPHPTKDYLNYFDAFKNHEDKNILSECGTSLEKLVEIINSHGYRLKVNNSYKLFSIFFLIVEIRNKCAHGNISTVTYEKISIEYERILKKLVYLLPLDKFILYGEHNGCKLELIGQNPKMLSTQSNYLFSIESSLLENSPCSEIPFIQYHYDTQELYYLNDKVSPKLNECEHINYPNGTIQYWKVLVPKTKLSTFSGEFKVRNSEVEDKDFQLISEMEAEWKPLPLSKDSLKLLPSKSHMIYTFCIKPKVFGQKSYQMLYIGRSEDPQNRFRDYLRVNEGYNKSRPEIKAMLEKYKNNIVFMYIILKGGGFNFEVQRPDF